MTRPALLLDVMSTLVWDPFVVLPDFFGLPMGHLLAAKHPTTWQEFERGEIDEATMLSRFFRDGRHVDGVALKALMHQSYRWIDGMEQLLAELRDARVEMHALSNYCRWYELIEDKLGVSRFVPWTFVSCVTGVRKPDPASYTDAARHLGRPVADCLFVDDRRSNCEAGVAVGMPAIVFEDAGTLRTELVQRGVLL